jgi:hypothetical protein
VDSNFPFRAGARTVVGLLAPDRSSLDSPLEEDGFELRVPLFEKLYRVLSKGNAERFILRRIHGEDA